MSEPKVLKRKETIFQRKRKETKVVSIEAQKFTDKLRKNQNKYLANYPCPSEEPPKPPASAQRFITPPGSPRSNSLASDKPVPIGFRVHNIVDQESKSKAIQRKATVQPEDPERKVSLPPIPSDRITRKATVQPDDYHSDKSGSKPLLRKFTVQPVPDLPTPQVSRPAVPPPRPVACLPPEHKRPTLIEPDPELETSQPQEVRSERATSEPPAFDPILAATALMGLPSPTIALPPVPDVPPLPIHTLAEIEAEELHTAPLSPDSPTTDSEKKRRETDRKTHDRKSPRVNRNKITKEGLEKISKGEEDAADELEKKYANRKTPRRPKIENEDDEEFDKILNARKSPVRERKHSPQVSDDMEAKLNNRKSPRVVRMGREKIYPEDLLKLQAEEENMAQEQSPTQRNSNPQNSQALNDTNELDLQLLEMSVPLQKYQAISRKKVGGRENLAKLFSEETTTAPESTKSPRAKGELYKIFGDEGPPPNNDINSSPPLSPRDGQPLISPRKERPLNPPDAFLLNFQTNDIFSDHSPFPDHTPEPMVARKAKNRGFIQLPNEPTIHDADIEQILENEIDLLQVAEMEFTPIEIPEDGQLEEKSAPTFVPTNRRNKTKAIILDKSELTNVLAELNS